MQTQAQMQAQGNEKFSISCVGACACVCVCVLVVHTSICLRLHLRLRRSCEPALRPSKIQDQLELARLKQHNLQLELQILTRKEKLAGVSEKYI